jgi:hypothetical protein
MHILEMKQYFLITAELSKSTLLPFLFSICHLKVSRYIMENTVKFTTTDQGNRKRTKKSKSLKTNVTVKSTTEIMDGQPFPRCQTKFHLAFASCLNH